ncbi:MAG: NAD(P)-dependent oxidoreductase [Pseudomonadota bacterium]
MKYIIVGGDGFVGRYIVRDLLRDSQSVLVCDINKSPIPTYQKAEHRYTDITSLADVVDIPFEEGDVVINVAARMLHPIVKRRRRHDYFFSVDFEGAKNVVDAMLDKGCSQLVQFSTDMVYGYPAYDPPLRSDHPRVPIGEYSDSKKYIEDYCIEKRGDGLRVSIFRPRLIIGPGRLGVLTNLFRLIRKSLPVPLIGNGSNRYQMVSVFDCASAAIASTKKGVVNGEYNLGSESPPTVIDLLGGLIDRVGSKSLLIPTPATLVKLTLRSLDRMDLSLMVPEQFEIADTDYVVDISNTKSDLGWSPQYTDESMLNKAYDDFINNNQSSDVFEN